MSYSFVANLIRFSVVQKIENRLRFAKVTESLMVETFLRHSVVVTFKRCEFCSCIELDKFWSQKTTKFNNLIIACIAVK